MGIKLQDFFDKLPKERQEKILKRTEEIHKEYLEQKKKEEENSINNS